MGTTYTADQQSSGVLQTIVLKTAPKKPPICNDLIVQWLWKNNTVPSDCLLDKPTIVLPLRTIVLETAQKLHFW